jgi:hypothetical protein
VYAADLDGDGDPDLLARSGGSRVVWFRNEGGCAHLYVTDTSPLSIANAVEEDLFQVVFTHNGIASDRTLELNTFALDLLRDDCSTPLTSAEANAIIDNLRVRLDDGDAAFETDGSDSIEADVGTLNLSGGVQTVTFTDGDSDVQVSAGGVISKTYWISVLTTGDASQQDPRSFCMRFDPDADALVEGKTPDFSVSIQDSEPTDTGGTPTAVDLTSLTATADGSAVLIAWETADEFDLLGFHLYRATAAEGPYVRLNGGLIPAQNPGSPLGATYVWRDGDVQAGITYHYKLEAQDGQGLHTLRGPVSVWVPYVLYLPLVLTP